LKKFFFRMVRYGFMGGLALMSGVVSIFDFIIGALYLASWLRAPNLAHRDLLQDKRFATGS